MTKGGATIINAAAGTGGNLFLTPSLSRMLLATMGTIPKLKAMAITGGLCGSSLTPRYTSARPEHYLKQIEQIGG